MVYYRERIRIKINQRKRQNPIVVHLYILSSPLLGTNHSYSYLNQILCCERDPIPLSPSREHHPKTCSHHFPHHPLSTDRQDKDPLSYIHPVSLPPLSTKLNRIFLCIPTFSPSVPRARLDQSFTLTAPARQLLPRPPVTCTLLEPTCQSQTHLT